MTSGTACADATGLSQKRTKIRFTVPQPVAGDKEGDQRLLSRGYAFEFCIEWVGTLTLERARFRAQVESKDDFQLACAMSPACTKLEADENRVEIDPFDYSIL